MSKPLTVAVLETRIDGNTQVRLRQEKLPFDAGQFEAICCVDFTSGLIGFHTVPGPRLLIMIQGLIQITASNGENIILKPGQLIEFHDLSGKGHSSEILSASGVQLVWLCRSTSSIPKTFLPQFSNLASIPLSEFLAEKSLYGVHLSERVIKPTPLELRHVSAIAKFRATFRTAEFTTDVGLDGVSESDIAFYLPY